MADIDIALAILAESIPINVGRKRFNDMQMALQDVRNAISTERSNHLAQIVINHGDTYQARVLAAKISKPNHQHLKARAFVEFAAERAAWYARTFRDEPPFSARDTLLAAHELLDYYERHVAEGV